MVGMDLVIPVGEYEQTVQTVDTTGEELYKIQSRLIRPMDILEYNKTLAFQAVQCMKYPCEQLRPVGNVPAVLPNIIPYLPDYIIKWSQWPGSKQGVTGALVDPGAAFLAESPDQ